MHPKLCAECGGKVIPSVGPLSFEVRGETVRVEDVEHAECRECGEVYLSLDAAQQLQSKAISLSKAARNLLTPEEIRDLRHTLSLSQAAFEKLLGAGPKTVVRWERGTVFQSATADRLMRLIRRMPALVDVLSSGELYASGRAAREYRHPALPEPGRRTIARK